MSDKDGGPAFPRTPYEGPSGVSLSQVGMTLWDYYAAAAMSGMDLKNYERASDAAINAGKFADAMLAERKKRGIGQ